MINVTRIMSVEYYEAQNKQAHADTPGAKPQEVGRDGEKRDAVAYYTDNGAAESRGVWWTRKTQPGDPAASLSSSSPTPSAPFGACQDGQDVDSRVLRALAAGLDPATKSPIVNGRTGQPIRPTGGKASVGYDVQISAPKSVSLLAAAGDEKQRQQVFDAHDRAFRRALDFAFDQGLIISRAGKGGHEREPVAEITAATYRHFTSRAGDPQLHSHGVLLNVAVRADGTAGTIDNHAIMKYRGAIAALYRAELAAELKREFGIEVERKGRNFEIAGVPDAVLERFSKRRQMIEKDATARGYETAENREAAQVASFQTRTGKAELPAFEELEKRWDRELSEEGWSRTSIWKAAESAGRRIRAERDAGGEERATTAQQALKALGRILQNEATFDQRTMMRMVAEELQTETNADGVLAALKQIEVSGAIVEVGRDPAGEAIYSTREIVEAERAMLASAYKRQGERPFVPEATLEAVIASYPTMRAEQAAAVRHALNADGISIVEGLAGTGKSFSTGALAEVARKAGLEVHGIAPSWKAVDVLKTDAQIAEEMARATAGFVSRLEKGEIKLSAKSVVILDEAGMVGTTDMAALVRHAEKAGAKLILSGDTRQLQPVVAGAPMVALARAIGSAKMEEIARQKGRTEAEGAWMRAASQDFATGDPVRAMEAYDKAGAIKWTEDRETAIRELVADYVADRTSAAEKTRAVLTAWNVDVREINEGIRAELKAAGVVAAEEVEIKAVPRGGAKAQTLALAIGDDVIFGESVEIRPGLTLRNADIGRIEAIDATNPDDPSLTIRLAKGETFTTSVSGLVGFRGQPDDGEEAVAAAPRIQHAYAMTVHASQGVTVDRAYVANFRGMGRESTYVAMTRHREAVRVYADTSRVYDDVAAQAPAEMEASSHGISLPEIGELRAGEPDLAALRRAIMEEAKNSDRKTNASDFVKDVRTWAGVAPRSTETVTRPVAETAPAVRQALQKPFRVMPSRPTPDNDTAAVTSRAAALAVQIDERKRAAVKYPPATASRGGRITSEEFDHFARQDLAAFAEREGLKPIGPWERGKGGEEFRTYQDPTKSDGSRVNIARWPSGKWSFAARDGSASGGITQFMTWRSGISSIAAAHELRRYFGTDPGQRQALTAEGRPIVRKTVAKGRAGQGATHVDQKTPEERAKALQLIRHNWQRLVDGANDYLGRVRGIRTSVLQRFRSEIKTEPGDPTKPWFIGGTAAFAHRDLSGALVGYERKGEEFQQDGKRSFSRMAKGSEKTLTMMGETKAPTRIYVAESGVEALSIYQHDGEPAGALLCSPYGNPSPAGVAQLAELAKRNPGAEIHLAFNNDEAGRVFQEKFTAAAKEAAGTKLTIVDRSPDPAFKDWNDEIRGITVEKAQQAAAERKAAAEAEQAAEADAKRQAEEKARLQPEHAEEKPAYRPRLR